MLREPIFFGSLSVTFSECMKRNCNCCFSYFKAKSTPSGASGGRQDSSDDDSSDEEVEKMETDNHIPTVCLSYYF